MDVNEPFDVIQFLQEVRHSFNLHLGEHFRSTVSLGARIFTSPLLWNSVQTCSFFSDRILSDSCFHFSRSKCRANCFTSVRLSLCFASVSLVRQFLMIPGTLKPVLRVPSVNQTSAFKGYLIYILIAVVHFNSQLTFIKHPPVYKGHFTWSLHWLLMKRFHCMLLCFSWLWCQYILTNSKIWIPVNGQQNITNS